MEEEANVYQLSHLKASLMDPYSFARIDALLEHYYGSPSTSSWKALVDDPRMDRLVGFVILGIALLKASIMDPEEFPPGLFVDILSSGIEVDETISLFNLEEMDPDMARELFTKIYSRLGPVGTIMRHAPRDVVVRSNQSFDYFPRSGELDFLNSLLGNIQEMVEAKAQTTGPLRFYLFQTRKHLLYLSSRLMEVPEPRREEPDLKALLQSISDLAYQVEYLIDLFLVGEIPIFRIMIGLLNIEGKLVDILRQVQGQFGEIRAVVNRTANANPVELRMIPIVNKIEISEDFRQVFNYPDIVHNFDIRMMSLASSYTERKMAMLHGLLDSLSHKSDTDVAHGGKEAYTSEMNEHELENLVHELLKNRRYFIFLEDVQDIYVLNDLRRFLPDDRSSSRVLFTTRIPKLAAECYHGSSEVVSSDVPLDHTSTSQTKKSSANNDVVGFHNETERMLELLTRGPKTQQIISIFGMPGQGKTTLAEKLYSHDSIVEYFDVRTWCCVSQVYEKKKLLLELLSQVDQRVGTISNKSDEELAAMLYKHLKERRFLIFLDDIWTIDAWNDLKRCFPDDKNGSRIMFTTRMKDLVSKSSSNSILQSLSPLSNDESWELLRKKVFGEESCPDELSGVGKEIAENCKGLPLSIVLIAGLLAKRERKVDQWEHLAKTLSSHLLSDVEAQGKVVIELSYKHLPDPLKPCFLYFGAFLEDREIPASKLIQLWIAEGFIEYSNSNKSEDVAEHYLMDLIRRSLVTGTQEKSNGGVKSCRVHDLLREFCLTKAKEENFLQQINGYDEYFPSYNDNLDYGINPHYSYSSTPITYHLRRLCIHSKRNHFIMLNPSGPLVRSLILIPSNDMCPSYSYDISFISQNFKLLKILDLEAINVGDSFKAIDILVLLRYLAVQVSINSIPSSIVNLWNLEYFLVKGSSSKVIDVPSSIWDMENLRHMHIKDAATFDLRPHNLEKSSIVDNLQTFSTPTLAYGDNMEKILKRLRGIRKLKCIFLDSWDDIRKCNRFPDLKSLDRLVSLKVFYNGKGQYPCELNFPSNLKKLTLLNFRLPWNLFSQLATLQNLEVLKLLDNAFEGETWEMEEEVFQNLKFLELEMLDFVTWIASAENFPYLKHLVLSKCKQLQEIPNGIGDIPTLEMIDVIWCSSTVAASARNIEAEYGEGLKVNIFESEYVASTIVATEKLTGAD